MKNERSLREKIERAIDALSEVEPCDAEYREESWGDGIWTKTLKASKLGPLDADLRRYEKRFAGYHPPPCEEEERPMQSPYMNLMTCPTFCARCHAEALAAMRHLLKVNKEETTELFRPHGDQSPRGDWFDSASGTVWLGGKPYPLTEVRAAIVGRFIQARGGLVVGKTLSREGICGSRPDKIIKELPDPVRACISGTQNAGYSWAWPGERDAT